MAIELTQDTLVLVDLWREGTGLGRSAAVEVLVGCAMTQGLVLPKAPGMAQAISEVEVWDESDAEEATGPEAGAPADAAEATGSSTPASSVGTP